MSLINQLPFDEIPGSIYRSPMPFGPYDENHQIYTQILDLEINAVVMLISDDEALEKTGINLKQLYDQDGLQVIYFPIRDFDVPEREQLSIIINQIIRLAYQGKNVLVHCSAGCGRTGLFLAEITKVIKNLPGEEAINWVRKYIPCAIETQEQIDFILEKS